MLSWLSALFHRRSEPTTIEISPGVHMPLIFNGISNNPGMWLGRGGRGIDTAFLYGDDQQRRVGRAIAESGLPRSEIFLTTKVNCTLLMRQRECSSHTRF